MEIKYTNFKMYLTFILINLKFLKSVPEWVIIKAAKLPQAIMYSLGPNVGL